MNKAYILHRYPYQESSLLLKCFVREVGLLAVIARGARKGKSRWRGMCQSFMPLVIEVKGRGSVLTLTQVEIEGQAMRFDQRELASAFYLNELLMSLLAEGEAHSELFDAYQQALLKLKTAVEPALRSFELFLLESLGYGLHLEEDQAHRPIIPANRYQVMPGELPQQVGANEAGYWGSELLAISQQEWNQPGVLPAAKRLLRVWIGYYTQGRKFNSRQLLAKGLL